MPVPTLRTDRLILRPFQTTDTEAIHAFASDPEVVHHMFWGPNTPAETADFLRSRLAAQDSEHPDEYLFAITLAKNGSLIGSCGLTVEDQSAAEGSIGYVLRKDRWGSGFATEAAGQLLRFGFEQLGMRRIFATCRPENSASRRLLEKIGMHQEAHLRRHIQIRGEWRDTLVYAILAEEWAGRRITAVIFDMDGVMVNTEPVYFKSNQEIFNRLGISVDAEGYARFVGLSAEKMWEILKKEHGLTRSIEELVRLEEEGMLQGLAQADLKPMPGLVNLLNQLQTPGIPLAVASSSPRAVIRLILEKLAIADRFLAVVSGEDVANGKPAPDIFLLAASKLGASPAACLVIEDSASGVRGAKAAGMTCIGFRNPHSGNQDLSPADFVISGFEDEAIERIRSLISRP